MCIFEVVHLFTWKLEAVDLNVWSITKPQWCGLLTLSLNGCFWLSDSSREKISKDNHLDHSASLPSQSVCFPPSASFHINDTSCVFTGLSYLDVTMERTKIYCCLSGIKQPVLSYWIYHLSFIWCNSNDCSCHINYLLHYQRARCLKPQMALHQVQWHHRSKSRNEFKQQCRQLLHKHFTNYCTQTTCMHIHTNTTHTHTDFISTWKQILYVQSFHGECT